MGCIQFRRFSNTVFLAICAVLLCSSVYSLRLDSGPLIVCDYALSRTIWSSSELSDPVSINMTRESKPEGMCERSCNEDVVISANNNKFQLFWNFSKYNPSRVFNVQFCVEERDEYPYTHRNRYLVVPASAVTEEDVELSLHCTYSGSDVGLQAIIYNRNSMKTPQQCYGSTPVFPMPSLSQVLTRPIQTATTPRQQPASGVSTSHKMTLCTGCNEAPGTHIVPDSGGDKSMNAGAISAVVCGSLSAVVIAAGVITLVYKRGKPPHSILNNTAEDPLHLKVIDGTQHTSTSHREPKDHCHISPHVGQGMPNNSTTEVPELNSKLHGPFFNTNTSNVGDSLTWDHNGDKRLESCHGTCMDHLPSHDRQTRPMSTQRTWSFTDRTGAKTHSSLCLKDMHHDSDCRHTQNNGHQCESGDYHDVYDSATGHQGRPSLEGMRLTRSHYQPSTRHVTQPELQTTLKARTKPTEQTSTGNLDLRSFSQAMMEYNKSSR